MPATAPESPQVRPTAALPARSVRTSPRRLVVDRIAAWMIRAGGMAIIVGILGILAFILLEVAPLARSARVSTVGQIPLPGSGRSALVGDEHRAVAVALSDAGLLRAVDLATGAVMDERPALPGVDGGATPLTGPRAVAGRALAGMTDDGRVVAVPIGFQATFTDGTRRVDAEIGPPIVFVPAVGGAVGSWTVRVGEDGAAMAAIQREDHDVELVVRRVDENLLTGEMTETWTRRVLAFDRTLTLLELDAGRKNLYAGTRDGSVVWWSLTDNGAPRVEAGDADVTALCLLTGDRTLVVGRADGDIEIWFPVRQDDAPARLTRIREFPGRGDAVRHAVPSSRNKGFLAQDAGGRLGLYHSTSHRVLWSGPSPLPAATALAYAPKGDGALLGGDGRLVTMSVDNPHPEIGLRALFGKVWYEGHDEPAWVWQSSGGTDEFEPKLSLTPLMVGTLKGTAYSLILAIPLGVLGAMYASQFMHPRLKQYVKPTVEIMAALPSVVLGFLAGLWLAPRMERVFPALALMLVALPLAVLLAGAIWRTLPRRFRGRMAPGTETAVYALALLVTAWGCLELNGPVERLLFGGDFPAWLIESTGLRYDQRNAVIVGLAMGFAVIPIIFSIAEDAFSNVPRNLVSGSLALGANRWQTVTRVVLPTASPGIFSAVMIGFGRAVGETMIVLMATGNTPLLDWNPFNGFRTLSANIAVEIPEAPYGGTLYRTLFLSALILFAFTFVLNTFAELVRQRLRQRYAQL